MKRNLLSLVTVLCVLLTAARMPAQTALSAGDMAFLSLKVSGDGFAFVTFKTLCPRTVIYFTDNPYSNTTGFCTSQEEFCISLTVTTTVPAGAQITYTDGTPGAFTFSAGAGNIAWAFGSEAGANNGFSSSGDNCFAFQGTYAAPTFICGIKTSAWTAGAPTCSDRGQTNLPSALTPGTSALFVNVGGNNGIYYNCSTTSGTTAALRAAINNSANWTSGTAPITAPCSFTVTDAPADPCSITCPCNIWSEDFNTTRYPTRTTTGANSNTLNPAADWTTTANDCDDATPFGTLNQSYWGTDAGVFKCNDIEGQCTPTCGGGGNTLNEWLTEVIDISSYTNVTICVDFASSGTMEPNTSATQCNNADDIIQGQFRINGGAWQPWFFDDDEVDLSPATRSGLSGSTLQLRIYLGNKANDEFHTIDNVCVSGTLIPLPVHLVSFEAEGIDPWRAQLSWRTASETNNDYFVIEKTTDGITWEEAARVDGQGTTTAVHDYSWIDEGPLSGITYYRLKQVDFNGHFEYSPTRPVMYETRGELQLFPNPANEMFTVSGLVSGLNSSVAIYNCAGRQVQMYQGQNAFIQVPTSDLAGGIYFVHVTEGDVVRIFELVVVHDR